MDRSKVVTVHQDGSRLPALRSEPMTVAVTPVTDIYETAEEYVVRLDLPGATRETIRVEAKSGMLTVTADVPLRDTVLESVLHREIVWNRFARSFNLGRGVHESGINAEVADGVLTVRIPKTDEARSREIPVR